MLLIYYSNKFFKDKPIEVCLNELLNGDEVQTLLTEIYMKTSKNVIVPEINVLVNNNIQPSTMYIPYNTPQGEKKACVNYRHREIADSVTADISISFADIFKNNLVQNINLVFMYKTSGANIANLFQSTPGYNTLNKDSYILYMDEELSDSDVNSLISVVNTKFPSTSNGKRYTCISIDKVIGKLTENSGEKQEYNTIFNSLTNTLSITSTEESNSSPVDKIECNGTSYIPFDVYKMMGVHKIELANSHVVAMQYVEQLTKYPDDVTTEDVVFDIADSTKGRGGLILTMVNNLINIRDSKYKRMLNESVSSGSNSLIDDFQNNTINGSSTRLKNKRDLFDNDAFSNGTIVGNTKNKFIINKSVSRMILSQFNSSIVIRDKTQTPEDYLRLISSSIIFSTLSKYLDKTYTKWNSTSTVKIKNDKNDSDESNMQVSHGLIFVGPISQCINTFKAVDNEGRLETSFKDIDEIESFKAFEQKIAKDFKTIVETANSNDALQITAEEAVVFTNIYRIVVEKPDGSSSIYVYTIKYQQIVRPDNYYHNIVCYQYELNN